ncbi:hypothetical protein WJX81_001851 [Elliptochloris bilobata]|uniref:Protein arginine methyltransferase NDUFAF7 n=1 Tax=Elliptochloris bilobata TaxID=381761 RepID=A0AAW1QV30_9CHLO
MLRGLSCAQLTTATEPQRQLLRDFLHDRLYHPTEGYFSAHQPPVGIGRPLDLPSLSGEDAYRMEVRRQYDDLAVAWLTPSELFTPHYGQAVAAFLLAEHARTAATGASLHVKEIGGGTGRLAVDVLDHVCAAAPEVHARMRYTCVEISTRLAALQRATLDAAPAHSGLCTVECRDAADTGGWGAPAEEHTFVLAMEVLDNMPHDRVARNARSGAWLQTCVVDTACDGLREELEPLQDGLVGRCLRVGDWASGGKSLWHRLLDFAVGEPGARGGDEIMYLPTRTLALLDALSTALPSHTLLAADFDALPDTSLPGAYAPLVATTVGGSTRDHASYLLPRGSADVFFPTDFGMLARLYEAAARAAPTQLAGVNTQHMKTVEFMKRFANLPATTTQSGYNPLLRDFTNTSFFVGQRA